MLETALETRSQELQYAMPVGKGCNPEASLLRIGKAGRIACRVNGLLGFTRERYQPSPQRQIDLLRPYPLYSFSDFALAKAPRIE